MEIKENRFVVMSQDKEKLGEAEKDSLHNPKKT